MHFTEISIPKRVFHQNNFFLFAKALISFDHPFLTVQRTALGLDATDAVNPEDEGDEEADCRTEEASPPSKPSWLIHL